MQGMIEELENEKRKTYVERWETSLQLLMRQKRHFVLNNNNIDIDTRNVDEQLLCFMYVFMYRI